MPTLLIAFNGNPATGQHLGDTLVSIKVAYLFAQHHPCERYLLALSPKGELNFLWQKFIDHFKVEVIYDTFGPSNNDERFAAWDKWRKERMIDGRPFDIYKELYKRVDGGHRQGRICGGEIGLGKKNIFEYFYFGQEDVRTPLIGADHFGSDLIYHELVPVERDVLIAPYAKCQGNAVWTMGYWEQVVRKLVAAGVTVTVANERPFCDDLAGPHYRRFFQSYEYLRDQVCRHRLVCCGNTGVGWMAGACGVPLLAMQHPESHIQDYRYEWCGVKSLVEFLEKPDVDYCVRRVQEEVSRVTVLTTGCYDLLHAGHVHHLQQSRAMGDRLVVALNSDASVRLLKGEGRPNLPQREREAVLRALRCVDDVRIFDGNSEELIRELRPDVLTNGYDRTLEEVVGKQLVEVYGGRVVLTSRTGDISTTKIVRRISGIDVLQAVKEAERYSPNPLAKLKFLAEQLLSVESVDGSLADLGAYRGACSLIMRRLSRKGLSVFDTWDGNPFNDPLCHHKKGEWKASLKECQSVVGQDELTFYHQGIFPDSAAGLEDERFSFVYVDVDTYQSTKAAIYWFWPRMVKGGKIVIDDYEWEPCAGVKKAVEEFCDPELYENIHVVNSLHTCVLVAK